MVAGTPSGDPPARTRVCPAPGAGQVSCLASGYAGGRRESTRPPGGEPRGYGPAQLRSAYRLPAQGAGGQRVAIVAAFDDPRADADLAVYRRTFRLPPCPAANGCLRIVDDHGGTGHPRVSRPWAAETSLDLDMVSAACEQCSILLVEAASDGIADMYRAVRQAVAQGATELSLSWGTREFPGETDFDATFAAAGIPVTAASGDLGYGAGYPAASPYVTAVGGTTLRPGGSARGWSEEAWSGSGSGCSRYEPKPVWQVDSGCSGRTVADLAVLADPNLGVAVYDSLPLGSGGEAGWTVLGGTSVGAPLVAGAYALAGGGAASASGLYRTPRLHDVVSGANGSCWPGYLCAAGPGYDGPTGLGTLSGPPPTSVPATTSPSGDPAAPPPLDGVRVPPVRRVTR